MLAQGLDKNGVQLEIGDMIRVIDKYDSYLAIVKELLNTGVNAQQIESISYTHYVSSSAMMRVSSLDD